MTDYSDIEIQTAENLLKEGYKWIVRNRTEKLLVYYSKPSHRGRLWISDDDGYGYCICEESIPIFKNVHFEDKEPISLESIVHPQILDDAERRYLAEVIRPFRDSVTSIVKSTISLNSGRFEEIVVEYDCFEDRFGFDLPPFECGTMYKGMETGKRYTLEELGL